jgi:arylsulfatase A-like enzyme
MSGVKTKTFVGTIDITPTWTGVLRFALPILEDPSQPAKVKEELRVELRRMAEIADAYVAITKKEHSK